MARYLPHRRCAWLPAEIRERASLALLPAEKSSNNASQDRLRKREKEKERGEGEKRANIDCNKELNAPDVTSHVVVS